MLYYCKMSLEMTGMPETWSSVKILGVIQLCGGCYCGGFITN
jgi:hypothetical protein